MRKPIVEILGILKARCAKNQELFERLGEIKVDENLRPEKLEDDDTLGAELFKVLKKST